MEARMNIRMKPVVYFAAAGLSAAALAANATNGPSSFQTPYIVRTVPGVVTTSILTTGDTALNGYRMVGLPDGLGAFDNGDGTFTVLMNHELGATSGTVRAHGATGAFVSRWIVRTSDLMVLSGEDLIQQIATWNTATGSWNAPAKGTALARLCSATLAPVSAFHDAASGLGYDGRIFTDGEENGTSGRAFAHLMDGTSYELPRLGKLSWENAVPNGGTGSRTVVAGTDDSGTGQIYVYAGEKTASAHPIEAAGLANGTLLGIKVQGLTQETDATTIAAATPFTVHDFGNVTSTSGAQLETLSMANGVTAFNRPEDAAWDPNNPNDLYFVTTASFSGRSRLWRLLFADASQPALGGTIDVLLTCTEGQHMFDNITIDGRGRVLLQEDPGNQSYIAKIWQYDVSRRSLTTIAEHDPERFAPGAAGFLTQDEESSGIIDVSDILGEGWFLLDVQSHRSVGDAELVEDGQLLAMHVPPGRKY
jgi:hypothetical protein